MVIRRLECGSAVDGDMAAGCEYCSEGSKMVLFVTGKCSTGCKYCPVSLERKGNAGTYANELKVMSDNDVIKEAEAMNALGTGITGGDPLCDIDLTLHYMRLIKNYFGPEHHIHLYTSMIDFEKACLLREAGLDEIRFHPREEEWMNFDTTELKKIVSIKGLDVGIEVPALPGREKDLDSMITKAFSAGALFVNLNELEFSESNWDMMKDNGYLLKDDISSAVRGSEETSLIVINAHPGERIHFCSSSFKDGIQLRRRLIRRAEHTAKDYEIVTDDGTILKGLLYADDLNKAAEFLRMEYDVPDSLMFIDEDRNRMEAAAWILQEIAEDLPYKCYIIEEYPTADRLEVERMPLGRQTR